MSHTSWQKNNKTKLFFFLIWKKIILTTDVNSTGAIWFDGRDLQSSNPATKDKEAHYQFHNHSSVTYSWVDIYSVHLCINETSRSTVILTWARVNAMLERSITLMEDSNQVFPEPTKATAQYVIWKGKVLKYHADLSPIIFPVLYSQCLSV